MAELTEEQKVLIAESIKAAQAQLKNDSTIPVIVQGSGVVTSDNPRFRIEQKAE